MPNLVSPIAHEAEKKLVKVLKNKLTKEALFVLFTNSYKLKFNLSFSFLYLNSHVYFDGYIFRWIEL